MHLLIMYIFTLKMPFDEKAVLQWLNTHIRSPIPGGSNHIIETIYYSISNLINNQDISFEDLNSYSEDQRVIFSKILLKNNGLQIFLILKFQLPQQLLQNNQFNKLFWSALELIANDQYTLINSKNINFTQKHIVSKSEKRKNSESGAAPNKHLKSKDL